MGLILNIINSLLAYNDARGVTQNPLQRAFDWERRYASVPVKNATSDFVTIPAGASYTLFDGTRSLPTALSAGSSVLEIQKLDSSKSLYRLKITAGAGQFRSQRTTGFNASTQITTTVNNNAVMTMAVPNSTNGDFTNAQVGDIVRVKGPNTGDNSQNAFSAANSGYWIVIAKDISNLSITVKRPANTLFQGVNETVTLGAILTSEQMMIYSQAGVLTSDSFIIGGTFSSASHNNYDIQQVGPTFIDFVSGEPLPEESGLTLVSASDILFYSNAKKLVYIETDQDIAVQYNLDSSNNNIVKPIQVGNDTLVGYANKWGFTWKCTVVNRSQINSVNIKWLVTE
jgi:hypothetical protein